MSNFNLKAKHKVTGTIHDFTALDHIHSYSYISEEYNMTFTSKEFNELYEVIKDKSYDIIEDKSYDIIETGNDKMSIAYVVPKENLNTIEIDGFKDRFDTEFTDSDTGLLNIGKYDYDRLLTWIKNEIK